MNGIGVAVLTEVLSHVVAESEVLGMGRLHLHATPSAPVTLCRQLCLQVPGGGAN